MRQKGILTISNPTGGGNVSFTIAGEPVQTPHTITLTASGNWTNEDTGWIRVYEGEDITGTVIFNQTPANKSAYPINIQTTSQTCFIKVYAPNPVARYVKSNDYTLVGSVGQYKFDVIKNGAINIAVSNFDD